MATDFNLTAQQIIEQAHWRTGAISDGDSVQAASLTTGLRVLNIIIKALQADGMNLWKRKDATLFLEKGKASYLIGPTGDHCTLTSIETTLTADEPITETVLAVTSTTGMAGGDNIGVILDDGTFHWTTIVTVNSSTQVTITAGLASAAESGNTLFTYTSKTARPLRVYEGRRINANATEIPLILESKSYYDLLTPKTSQGTIIQAYYDPQLTNGALYVWPTSDNITDRLILVVSLPFDTLTALSANTDFPQEWLDYLIAELAYRISGNFATTTQERSWLRDEAIEARTRVSGFDTEQASVFIYPASE